MRKGTRIENWTLRVRDIQFQMNLNRRLKAFVGHAKRARYAFVRSSFVCWRVYRAATKHSLSLFSPRRTLKRNARVESTSLRAKCVLNAHFEACQSDNCEHESLELARVSNGARLSTFYKVQRVQSSCNFLPPFIPIRYCLLQ